MQLVAHSICSQHVSSDTILGRARANVYINVEQKILLTVLDGKGAAQPAVFAPVRTRADEARLEDFDLVRLQAQHDDLVQSAWLEFILDLDRDTPVTPCSSSIRAVQCDPGIDQLVFVNKLMIPGVDCVKVACDDAAAASGLAQEASQYVHLEKTYELRVEGVEVDVEETQD